MATSTPIFTPAMVAAIQNAQQVMNATVGSGTLDQLSLTQIQPIINAFVDAYNVFEAGLQSPAGINLDAIPQVGATIDGINAFVTEASLVVAESAMQTALAYIGRIIANLRSFGG